MHETEDQGYVDDRLCDFSSLLMKSVMFFRSLCQQELKFCRCFSFPFAFFAVPPALIKREGLGFLAGLIGVRRRKDCWRSQNRKF